MKKKNRTRNLFLILVLVILIYIGINYVDLNDLLEVYSDELYLKLLFLLILVLCICIYILHNSKNSKRELKYRDKLFTTLVKNTDTIYIMIDTSNNSVVYLSDNVEQVLGIKINKDKAKRRDIVREILNIPILKSELKNWDGKSFYVSQMLLYENPRYSHQSWLKFKIYPYKEKNHSYNVIQVSEVSKEHDRQHLLITQTVDIKSREKQLDQITASSYDFEINVNITTHTYELRYFKLDMKYFGQEKSGNFNFDFKDIVKDYINEGDHELVLNTLSIKNFETLAAEKKLEPITIRYRLGNEIKNNTWLESTVFFITNKDKISVSILTKNVTENAESIREQNILLQNSVNEAKQASIAKTEMIRTISHDIRIPMTTIKGLSESLMNKKLDTDVMDDISNINESSNEVLEIIDGLLDISNIEKGIIKKEEKKYSILELFNDIVSETKEYIGTKDIKLNLDMNSNLPVILHGDSKRLNQILKNILNNSVKYTDEGEINIGVTGQKIDDKVELSIAVKDTGCGIEEDKLNNIFEQKSENGTGLSSIKNLIDLLDGTIEIESKLNEYTLVTITLTQKIVEDNKVREMMQHNQTAQIFSLEGKKVLLVDDNKLNLKVAARMLQTYDIEVTSVESGQECIDYVSKNNYDLILLDQMMPGMSGTETLNKLKEKDSFNIPVVVLTADAMSGQKEKYLKEGFDDYLSKPIDKLELSRILKEILK